MTETNPTTITTGTVRLSYLHVFEPKPTPDGTLKYSVSLLIDKNDAETIAQVKAAIKAAMEIGKAKMGSDWARNLKIPLRDGDTDRPGDEAYAGMLFLNASSKTKPALVDRNVQEIIEPNELYSGCYGKARISFYPYNVTANKGIGVGLNAIQKVRDGAPLRGGFEKPQDIFTPVTDIEAGATGFDIDSITTMDLGL